MPRVSEVIARLQGYDQNAIVTYDLWQSGDVLERAHERGVELTPDQVEEVLEFIENHKDANLGINWDTIDCAIDAIL